LNGRTYPLFVVKAAAPVISVAPDCHLKFVAVVFVNCNATTLIAAVALDATMAAVPSVLIDTVENAGTRTVVEFPFASHFVFWIMATADWSFAMTTGAAPADVPLPLTFSPFGDITTARAVLAATAALVVKYAVDNAAVMKVFDISAVMLALEISVVRLALDISAVRLALFTVTVPLTTDVSAIDCVMFAVMLALEISAVMLALEMLAVKLAFVMLAVRLAFVMSVVRLALVISAVRLALVISVETT
jgi:hypothetical protein